MGNRLRIRNREYWFAGVALCAFVAISVNAVYAQTADYFATPWLGVSTQPGNGVPPPPNALPAPGPTPPTPATAGEDAATISNLYAQSLASAQPAAPPVLITFNAGIDEIATDNVAETESDRVADLSSLISAGATVTSDSSRFRGVLSGTGFYRRNINDTGQDQFSEYGYGNGHATLIPGTLFFDVDGSADDLSREGGGIQ